MTGTQTNYGCFNRPPLKLYVSFVRVGDTQEFRCVIAYMNPDCQYLDSKTDPRYHGCQHAKHN